MFPEYMRKSIMHKLRFSKIKKSINLGTPL